MSSPEVIGQVEPSLITKALGPFEECDDYVYGNNSTHLVRKLVGGQRAPKELVTLIETLEGLAIGELGNEVCVLGLAFNTKPVQPGKFQIKNWHEDDRPDDSWAVTVADNLPTDFIDAGFDEVDPELLDQCSDLELQQSNLLLRFKPGDIIRFGGNVIHRSGINLSTAPQPRVWVGLIAKCS